MSVIKQMSLTLPATRRQRAERIARRVSEGIAAMDIPADRSYDRLQLPVISITQQTSDDELVRSIIAAVRDKLVKQL